VRTFYVSVKYLWADFRLFRVSTGISVRVGVPPSAVTAQLSADDGNGTRTGNLTINSPGTRRRYSQDGPVKTRRPSDKRARYKRRHNMIIITTIIIRRAHRVLSPSIRYNARAVGGGKRRDAYYYYYYYARVRALAVYEISPVKILHDVH